MDKSQKFEVLSDIRLAKGVFRSSSDLRRFAEENGIFQCPRLKALCLNLQFLATLPLEGIGELMRPYGF